MSRTSEVIAPEWRISEIRPDTLDAALAFAEEHGGRAIDRSRVRLRLSLTAQGEQGEIEAAAFCVPGDEHVIELHVVVAAAEPMALVRRLIDKVLCKMRCDHVHRLMIDLHYTEDAPSLWRVARWVDDAAAPLQ